MTTQWKTEKGRSGGPNSDMQSAPPRRQTRTLNLRITLIRTNCDIFRPFVRLVR